MFSLDVLADVLTRIIGSPVVNEMGVSGTYDLTLEWNEERKVSDSDSDQPPIFMALRS